MILNSSCVELSLIKLILESIKNMYKRWYPLKPISLGFSGSRSTVFHDYETGNRYQIEDDEQVKEYSAYTTRDTEHKTHSGKQKSRAHQLSNVKSKASTHGYQLFDKMPDKQITAKQFFRAK